MRQVNERTWLASFLAEKGGWKGLFVSERVVCTVLKRRPSGVGERGSGYSSPTAVSRFPFAGFDFVWEERLDLAYVGNT